MSKAKADEAYQRVLDAITNIAIQDADECCICFSARRRPDNGDLTIAWNDLDTFMKRGDVPTAWTKGPLKKEDPTLLVNILKD